MAEKLLRVFMHGKKELPDPGETMEPIKVKKIYSDDYPELVTANITGPEFRDGKAIFTFTNSYKPKG